MFFTGKHTDVRVEILLKNLFETTTLVAISLLMPHQHHFP